MSEPIEILKNHAVKLRADNDYLERQIIFLSERLEQYKDTLRCNIREIQGIWALVKTLESPVFPEKP